MGNKIDIGFHGYYPSQFLDSLPSWGKGKEETKFTYTFYNHFHPFVGDLVAQLNKKSIAGLLDADFHKSLKKDFFKDFYQPNEDDKTVEVVSFPEEIDVSEEGAYAVHNWELFFHIPMTIAVHLSKNQRFDDAQKWFHYIFDPTAQDGKFWRFLAFRDKDFKQSDDLLCLVSKSENELTDEERRRKRLVLSGYEQLRKNPFHPHVVARTRPLAYALGVVMKYLDNLIAWGDSLFRQDTIETINEATQLYVLAANILGPKPERIPPPGTTKPMTFAQLRKQWDELGNTLVEMECQFPFNMSFPITEGVDTDQANNLFGIGRTLYFCLPCNEKLLGYWDTVADRLFKIRHCMNIEGVVRQLPLFQPPIDPGMLVKAAAAGIDIGSLVSGLNQPPGSVCAQLMIQKALEIAGEVRAMGNNLLSALEKQDAEALARLRQAHEIIIQQLAQDARYLQWKEAEASTEALIKSREIALERYHYYQRLLGKPEDELQDVTSFSLERRELDEENFNEVYDALVDQYEKLIPKPGYPSFRMDEDHKKLALTSQEADELDHLEMAKVSALAASVFNDLASAFAPVPDADVDLHYWGIGGKVKLNVGTALVAAAKIAGSSLNILATWERDQAGIDSRTASYERRAFEWRLQARLAAQELMQIGRQIITSLIREQIACHEYENLKRQIRQAQEIDQFLHDKFTNEELYGWMAGELSKLYYEYYKFAFDVARQAEQTMKHELMRPEVDGRAFIKFNYWDGGRKGLLAGDALHLDLKRMEMAYLDANKREYELTKHISLRQLDPLALLNLKETGSCEVTLPEWLFDLDTPGHYMRRIKSVSLSIPAVTGPYSSVNCTLTLLKSSLRKSALLKDGEYARIDSEDDRFVDYYGTLQSVVTSSAQEDSGLFETNLHDERYLPFEGAGVISRWRLEMPKQFEQFDYATISDVIIHMKYTAREGGAQLKGVVENGLQTQLNELIDASGKTGLFRVFNLKHEFPDAWQSLKQNNSASFVLTKQHLPFFIRKYAPSIVGEIWLARAEGNPDTFAIHLKSGNADIDLNLGKDSTMNDLCIGQTNSINLDGDFILSAVEGFALDTLEELLLLVNYTLA